MAVPEPMQSSTVGILNSSSFTKSINMTLVAMLVYLVF